MARTKNTNQANQGDDAERARREKREGKRKVENSETREKDTGEELSPIWSEATEQDMDESVIPRPYGVQGRIRILKRMQFMSMRYPHAETLRELGIEDDLEDIFFHTELGEFMKLALPAYRDPAIQFLASFKFKKHPESASAELKRDGVGFITFKLSGTDYRFSVLELEKIYKFEEDVGLDMEMCVPGAELTSLWEMISSRPYEISKNKSGHIRSPAIRYAHKAIAHTLFARHECANVTKQELELIDISLVQKLQTLDNGDEMNGDLKRASMAVVVLDSFKQCMRNAEIAYERGKIKDSHLAIGSLITPILLATKIKLPKPTHPPKFMDVAYLNKTWFLRGMHKGKHIYRFEHPDFGRSKILLPNGELTSHNKREGIIFLPTAEQLFMDGGDATVEEEQRPDEGETSARAASEQGDFDFTPYNAEGSTSAIAKAHEHIKILQRGFKKQEGMIKKLTNMVNVLKDKLSCTSPKATENVEPVLRRSKRKRKTGRSPPPTSSTQPIDLDEIPTPPAQSP